MGERSRLLSEEPVELLPSPREPGPGAAATGVAALPTSAQICSCNNVDKGAICAAVDDG